MLEFSTSKLIKKSGVYGYTLIEILVSMSIIGIIFTFGYVSYRDFSRRQTVANAAKLIQGDLRFAQGMAIAGQKPSGCGASNTLKNYRFNRVSPSIYSIQVDCGGSPITIKTVGLPADVSMGDPSVNPLEFKVLGQGTNIGSSNWELILTQVGSTNTAKITMTSGGEIK